MRACHALLDGGHNVTLVGHTPGKAEALVEELKENVKNSNNSVGMLNTLPDEVVVQWYSPANLARGE